MFSLFGLGCYPLPRGRCWVGDFLQSPDKPVWSEFTCSGSAGTNVMIQPTVRGGRVLVVLLVCLHVVDPARILGLVPFNSRSHWQTFETLFKGLAIRGHQVDVVSHFPLKEVVPNYNDLSVDGSVKSLDGAYTVTDAENLSVMRLVYLMWMESNAVCDDVIKHPVVKTLAESKNNYDVVISEIFGTDCLVGFASKFDAPLVGVITSVPLPWSLDRVANPDHPAYTENYFLSAVAPFSFLERLWSAGFYFYTRLGQWYFSERYVDKISLELFGDNVPSTRDIIRNTSLILVNSHFSVNQPRALVPSVVEVGGLHTPPPKKLPKELQQYLDSGSQGVIYFSFGTLVRSDSFSTEKLQEIISAFGSLPQQVVWRANASNLPALPSNVKIVDWVPQNDVLHHPNVKVFITHGGQMGVQESISAGKPMLIMPLFGDQPLNAQKITALGNGIKLDIRDLTKEKLKDALLQLLHKPCYRDKAQQLSRIFKDRPMSPLDTAIYWIEYVIRHGASHKMQSAAMYLSWSEYLLLDVLVVILFYCFVFLKLCSLAYSIFQRYKKMPKDQKPKQEIKPKKQ